MKRYSIESSFGDWVSAPDADGPWVRYEDAANLQRQLAEREAELAALVHPFDLEKYRSGK
jgi:hypothetical protein